MRKLKRTFYIGTTTFLLGLGIVFSNNVLAAVEQETTTQVETTTVEETTPNETTTRNRQHPLKLRNRRKQQLWKNTQSLIYHLLSPK